MLDSLPVELLLLVANYIETPKNLINFMGCNRRMHEIRYLVTMSGRCGYNKYITSKQTGYIVDDIILADEENLNFSARKLSLSECVHTALAKLTTNSQYLTNLVDLVCSVDIPDLSILPVSIKYLTFGKFSRIPIRKPGGLEGLERLINLKSLSITRTIYTEPIMKLPSTLTILDIYNYNNIGQHDNNILDLTTIVEPATYPQKLQALTLIGQNYHLNNLPITLRKFTYSGGVSALLLPEGMTHIFVSRLINYEQGMFPKLKSFASSINQIPRNVKDLLLLDPINCNDLPEGVERVNIITDEKIEKLPQSLTHLDIYYKCDWDSDPFPFHLLTGLKHLQVAEIHVGDAEPVVELPDFDIKFNEKYNYSNSNTVCITRK